MPALSLKLRAFLAAYRWRRIDPVPCAELGPDLSAARVALVTSAGFVAPGDPPFDPDVRGGDFSFRVLPDGIDVQSLEEHHRSDAFDSSGIELDRNIGLPLDRLHELVAAGEVGSAAGRHVSLMGSITAPGRLTRDTAPAVAELLAGDDVDLALLVPM
jgi:D-proline reductase (dithiol) PrdB